MEPAFLRSACAEKELLACCARSSVQDRVAARIRKLAGGPLDWDYAIAQAQDHSVLPLLHRNLRAARELVPRAVLVLLDEVERASAVRCLAQSSELLRVVKLLESCGIRTLPYKGPVIAAQAYGDIAVRQFEDLDVILAQRDIPAADAGVRTLGYEPKFPWVHSPEGKSVVPGEYKYFNAPRQTILELHTEATLRHFPVPPPLGEFLDRAAGVSLGGQTVRTFRPEDALPVYCIHGTKDFWERLIWIADIADLLRSHPGLNWDFVLRTTTELRAQRMLHLGLALAAGILGAELPSEISARLKADSRARVMAAEIARRLLGYDARRRTARERFLFRRHAVEGPAASWHYALRLTLAPSEEDWQQTRLPRWLTPLQAAMRPFRLLRKYRLG
jgi:Uncharacterised nucleotidyltransferase